jgi:amino acid transporter
MAAVIYLLCALTCASCFTMLMRAYLTNGHGLLFWSALSFGGMTLNNALLVADKLALPTVDLSLVRLTVSLLSLVLLVFGLIWGEE